MKIINSKTHILSQVEFSVIRSYFKITGILDSEQYTIIWTLFYFSTYERKPFEGEKSAIE